MYKAKRLLAVLTAALMVVALLPAMTVNAEMTYDDYEFSSRTITSYLGSGEYVAIPDKIDGTNVTTIGESAFSGTDVRYISIPQYVTKIEDYAFADCYNLERIYIPSSVRNFGAGVFDGCGELVIYAPTSSTAYQYAYDNGINRRSGSATTMTLTLNPGSGGRVTPTSLTVTRDFEYGELPIPTRSGYSFDGWYTSSSGGDEVTRDTIVAKSSSHTIYAQWSQTRTPGVTTNPVSSLTNTGAILSGTIDSGSNITGFGFTLENLSSGNSKEYDMSGNATLRAGATNRGSLSSLEPGTRYRYRAWAENSYGRGEGNWVTFTTKTTSSTTTYTVTFNVNGGDPLPSSERTKEVAYGSNYGTLPTPTRDGYVFDGWYTGASSSSSSTRVTSSTKMDRRTDHTLYAHWTQVRAYTVTFNVNGGEALSSSERTKEVTTGETYGDMPVPYRDGYVFDGWYTSSSGGDLVTASTKVTKGANHTLYAHWIQMRTYNVTFNANGGTLSSSERTKEVTTGETYGYMPEPTRSNYTFAGWYTSSTSTSYTDLVTEYTVVRKTTAHTLYARWVSSSAPNVITDDPNGNVLNGTLDSIGGSRVTEFGFEVLNTSTGEVKSAKSSATSFSAGNSYYITVGSSDSDVIYLYRAYATNSKGTGFGQWVEFIPGSSSSDSCTVTFNVNGGTALSSGERTKTVYRGETYGDLPEPTRTGYVFEGWYTSASGGTLVTADTRVTKTSNHTLYAHWVQVKTCTVTFNVNGGTSLSTSERTKTVTTGETYGDMPEPTRTGYVFEGWYTSASGGTLVTADTRVTKTSNHTLYAHWTQVKTYTVTFNANGGTTLPSGERTKTVTYGSTYGTLPTPSRSGYTFLGWYTASSGGTLITATSTVTATSNHTLYAHWAQGTVSLPTVTTDAPTDITKGGATLNGTLTSLGGGTVTSFGFDVKNNTTGNENSVKVDRSDTNFTVGSHHVVTLTTSVAGASFSYRAWADNDAGRGYGEWVTFSVATGVLTFDANGGNVTPSTKYVTKGEVYGTLPEPTYAGHTFDGWYTSRTGGTKISETTVYSGSGDQTLYAHWSTETKPTNTANLTVGTATAAAGGTVNVPISIANNPGIAAFRLTVNYDKTRLTPASSQAVTHGPDMSVGSITSNIQQGGDMSSYDFVTVFFDNPTNFTGNGDIVNIAFKVADTVTPGTTIPITVTSDSNSAANENEELVSLNITNGAVNIVTRIPGDANGDGVVDGRDCIRLVRYVAGITKNIYFEAANVNGDTVVDTRDGIRLRQKLAGWDVTLQNVATAAAGKTVFSVGQVMANAGGYVDVPVSVTATDGFASFVLQLDYDKTKLTPISASQNSALLNGNFTCNTNESDHTLVVWFGASNVSVTGEIFTVRFKVTEGVSGEIPVTLTCNELFVQNLQPVEYELTDGAITITDDEIGSAYDYSVNSITLASKDGEKATFDVSVTANSEPDGGAVLVLAAYTEDGQLVDMATDTVELAKSATESHSLSLQTKQPIYNIKAYVWKNLNGMTPLSKALSVSTELEDE